MAPGCQLCLLVYTQLATINGVTEAPERPVLYLAEPVYAKQTLCSGNLLNNTSSKRLHSQYSIIC